MIIWIISLITGHYVIDWMMPPPPSSALPELPTMNIGCQYWGFIYRVVTLNNGEWSMNKFPISMAKCRGQSSPASVTGINNRNIIVSWSASWPSAWSIVINHTDYRLLAGHQSISPTIITVNTVSFITGSDRHNGSPSSPVSRGSPGPTMAEWAWLNNIFTIHWSLIRQ